MSTTLRDSVVVRQESPINLHLKFQRQVNEEAWSNESLPLEERLILADAAVKHARAMLRQYTRRTTDAETTLLAIRSGAIDMIEVSGPTGIGFFMNDAEANEYIKMICAAKDCKPDEFKVKPIKMMRDETGRFHQYHKI